MDESNDELVPLSQVTKFLPPKLKHLHASTAIRWALRGVGNPRVKIETVKIGGRRFVTRAAVECFIARLTGAETARTTMSAQRGRQIRQAEQALEADGL